MPKNKTQKKPAPNPPKPRPRIKAPEVSTRETAAALKMAKRKGGVSAGELAERLTIAPSRASHVLKLLRNASGVRLEGTTRNARYFAQEPA